MLLVVAVVAVVVIVLLVFVVLLHLQFHLNCCTAAPLAVSAFAYFDFKLVFMSHAKRG